MLASFPATFVLSNNLMAQGTCNLKFLFYAMCNILKLNMAHFVHKNARLKCIEKTYFRIIFEETGGNV
jgi:hypothetical protein